MNKIAVAGKGGVGKTTLAAILARIYAEDGLSVIAVDADPAASLGYALGLPRELQDKVTPISKMDDLIRERTGAEPGSYGTYFKLNPQVDDIPETCSISFKGIKLLRLGSIELGGSGCICPESAVLKSLVTYLILHNNEVLIMDMDAGLEHLGRATAGAVDDLLVVVEPGRRSMETALKIAQLANDIGVLNISLVANKIRNEEDLYYIQQNAGNLPIIGYLPYTPLAVEADKEGSSVFDTAPELSEEVRKIVAKMKK